MANEDAERLHKAQAAIDKAKKALEAAKASRDPDAINRANAVYQDAVREGNAAFYQHPEQPIATAEQARGNLPWYQQPNTEPGTPMLHPSLPPVAPSAPVPVPAANPYYPQSSIMPDWMNQNPFAPGGTDWAAIGPGSNMNTIGSIQPELPPPLPDLDDAGDDFEQTQRYYNKARPLDPMAVAARGIAMNNMMGNGVGRNVHQDAWGKMTRLWGQADRNRARQDAFDLQKYKIDSLREMSKDMYGSLGGGMMPQMPQQSHLPPVRTPLMPLSSVRGLGQAIRGPAPTGSDQMSVMRRNAMNQLAGKAEASFSPARRAFNTRAEKSMYDANNRQAANAVAWQDIASKFNRGKGNAMNDKFRLLTRALG